MKTLKASSQYKKDYKRFRNNPDKVRKLHEILMKLANEEPIPENNFPHKLTGDYKGYLECHIESDFLLIRFDPDADEPDVDALPSAVLFNLIRELPEGIELYLIWMLLKIRVIKILHNCCT